MYYWKLVVRCGHIKAEYYFYKMLVDCIPDVDPNSKERAERYMAMSVMSFDLLGEELRIPAKELVSLFSKVGFPFIPPDLRKLETNSFNISDDDFQPIGLGIYPIPALINHSCSPNSVTVFEGDEVFVRALEPIPVGSEVYIHERLFQTCSDYSCLHRIGHACCQAKTRTAIKFWFLM